MHLEHTMPRDTEKAWHWHTCSRWHPLNRKPKALMRQTGNRMKFSIPGKRIIEVILGHNRWLQKSIRLFGQRKGLAASISSWHCLNVCDIWREAHSLCHSWDIHIKPLTYFWLIVWHKHIRVLAITDYPNNPLNSKFLLLVISENVRPNKLQNLLTTKNVKKFFKIQLLSHSGSMTFIASYNLQDSQWNGAVEDIINGISRWTLAIQVASSDKWERKWYTFFGAFWYPTPEEIAKGFLSGKHIELGCKLYFKQNLQL